LLSDDQAPQQETEAEETVFFVHPSGWKAYQIFASLITQWRIISTTNGALLYQGIDYAAAWAAIKAHKPKHPNRIFRQIQYLEKGAVSKING